MGYKNERKKYVCFGEAETSPVTRCRPNWQRLNYPQSAISIKMGEFLHSLVSSTHFQIAHFKCARLC